MWWRGLVFYKKKSKKPRLRVTPKKTLFMGVCLLVPNLGLAFFFYSRKLLDTHFYNRPRVPTQTPPPPHTVPRGSLTTTQRLPPHIGACFVFI